ncbi:hypothetical protein [Microvirga brassicacearum]|uniref:Lipoprotein n=1 Tax=Microvirga brassicacearum TaxID=2580413 RepID=A0A5N3P4S4_9HYPH|nr:hypothetical protein [Microvirga brassicacearum]KAB0264727.1 hypothetical protein FEZ63_22015 [Microvirga brassicacearum]
MKPTSLAFFVTIATMLAGCQTLDQRVEARSKLVCFQAGYGETSPRHRECMETLTPVAMDMERKAALRQFNEGLDTIAAGLNRNDGGVTCVTSGSVTRCR